MRENPFVASPDIARDVNILARIGRRARTHIRVFVASSKSRDRGGLLLLFFLPPVGKVIFAGFLFDTHRSVSPLPPHPMLHRTEPFTMPKKRRANGRNKPANARGHVSAPTVARL